MLPHASPGGTGDSACLRGLVSLCGGHFCAFALGDRQQWSATEDGRRGDFEMSYVRLFQIHPSSPKTVSEIYDSQKVKHSHARVVFVLEKCELLRNCQNLEIVTAK